MYSSSRPHNPNPFAKGPIRTCWNISNVQDEGLSQIRPVGDREGSPPSYTVTLEVVTRVTLTYVLPSNPIRLVVADN